MKLVDRPVLTNLTWINAKFGMPGLRFLSVFRKENAKSPAQESFVLRRTFSDFFPIGALLALLGVALWPLYYAGAIAEYPAILHARLMVEGFMASFIIGFLGTAGPRITSASYFSRTELLLLVTSGF